MTHVTFLIKKWSYKEKLSTKYTKTALESSSIIIIPLPYLHKVFLVQVKPFKSLISRKNQWSPCCLIFHHGAIKTKNLPVAPCSPCVIFGPLIISRHRILKTLLSKVSFCIFHDTNHYKNNQNEQKQVSYFGSLMVNFPFHGTMKTLILNMDWYAHDMINLWQLQHWKPVIQRFGVISQ